MTDFAAPIIWEWEGFLESPMGQYAPKDPLGLPRVGVGQPLWQIDQTLAGAAQPADGSRRGVGVFAFALHPQGQQHIQKVEFTLDFKPLGGEAAPLVLDLSPQTSVEQRDSSLTLGLEPKIKTADVEVSGLKAGYTINYKTPHIITIASGVQQTYARWTFEPGNTQPLVGDQRVRVELRVPASGRVRARAALSVEVANALGPLKGLLPQAEQHHFNWVLG